MSTCIEHTFFHPNKYKIELEPGEINKPIEIHPSNNDGYHILEDVFYEPRENAKIFLLSKIFVSETTWFLTFINMDTKRAIIDVSTLERKYCGYKPL